MLPWYLWALAGLAVVVTWLSWRVPLARLWVALGAASFIASSLAHDLGMAPDKATLFGAFTNLVVMCALYAYAQRPYEIVFWGCFIVMTMIDVLYMFDYVKAHFDFAFGLEAANWIALLSIGAAGIAERFRRGLPYLSVQRTRPGWVGAFHHRVRAAGTADEGAREDREDTREAELARFVHW